MAGWGDDGVKFSGVSDQDSIFRLVAEFQRCTPILVSLGLV